MKKILLFLITIFLVGCGVSEEELEKDRTFLKSPGLSYDHVLLNWNEPVEIKYLNTDKFIAVWEKGDGLVASYQIRVLFERKKVVRWKIEEIDVNKQLSKEISAAR